jgi:hypothetical protein
MSLQKNDLSALAALAAGSAGALVAVQPARAGDSGIVF